MIALTDLIPDSNYGVCDNVYVFLLIQVTPKFLTEVIRKYLFGMWELFTYSNISWILNTFIYDIWQSGLY